MKYTVYDLQTGKIKRCISINPKVSPFFNYDEGILEGHYKGNEYYVDTSTYPVSAVKKQQFDIVVNKTSIASNGIDSCIFTNIPTGTQCTISKEFELVGREEVNDGTVEFSSEQDGTYTVEFQRNHFKTKKMEVTAS